MLDGKLEEIARWLKINKMPESRLGLLSCANPRAIERIRDATARVATLEAVLKYIRHNPKIQAN